MRRFLSATLPTCGLLFLLFTQNELRAQAGPAELKDPLGRQTPQSSIFQFLEACHSRDYAKASHYLDLHRMPAAERAASGPALAQQLEDLLDDTPFDIATVTRDAEGDQTDGATTATAHVATFHVHGQSVDLDLERQELKPGLRVWLVSAGSVALIPLAHQLVAESPFEKRLPQVLVTFEVFDTPVWRWIALALMGAAVWFLARMLAWALLGMAPPMLGVSRVAAGARLQGPLRLCLAPAGFRGALELAPPASLARLFIERGAGLVFFLALAWAGSAIVDLLADRWHSSLDPRTNAIGYSVLPLGRQVLKMSLFLAAVLGVVSAWGYNTTTILAGLGVGGLAIALAAQKTIENLFGGVSVIGDRPVLVGDVCRWGGHTGTVMHIGLRSTRLRTPERTIVCVPNAQFASMELENVSGRDKMWFHPTLNLRRDTSAAQLTEVLGAIARILAEHPKVEVGKLPVRFVGVGQWSLDVEVTAYVATTDFEEFLASQQELLLKILRAVEAAGTALAVPLQETADPRVRAGRA